MDAAEAQACLARARRAYHAATAQRRREAYLAALRLHGAHARAREEAGAAAPGPWSGAGAATAAESLRAFVAAWGAYAGVARWLGSLRLLLIFQTRGAGARTARWELDDAALIESGPEDVAHAAPRLLVRLGLVPDGFPAPAPAPAPQQGAQADDMAPRICVRVWAVRAALRNSYLQSLVEIIPASYVPRAFAHALDGEPPGHARAARQRPTAAAAAEEGRGDTASGTVVRLPTGRAWASYEARTLGWDDDVGSRASLLGVLVRVWRWLCAWVRGGGACWH